jgi:hypothetical protein
MSREVRIPKPHATRLRSKASSCHCKYTRMIRLQCIYNFWCSMLAFYTICLLFRYTSWHFYAFSGTNLLTSCHSASSLFSAVFVFQKWYTGNILRIGRNKFLKSYFTRKLPETRRRVGGGAPGAHMPGWRGQPLAHATMVWGHLAPPLTLPLRL